jgi:hypothetical protein
MKLIENPRGNYRFLTGIVPYSSGVAAAQGYEIVRSILAQAVDWQQGFEIIDKVLSAAGRPRQALCSVEMRIPRPLPLIGFVDFNLEYREKLESWDIILDDDNPVARTNVAPLGGALPNPSLYAFSYTVPSANPKPTFIVAGAGDVTDQNLDPYVVVRTGESSIDAMSEKVNTVMSVMEERLHGLKVSWRDVIDVDVYTAEPNWAAVVQKMIGMMGHNPAHGFHWYLADPPIEGLAFEMDLRGLRSNNILDRSLV